MRGISLCRVHAITAALCRKSFCLATRLSVICAACSTSLARYMQHSKFAMSCVCRQRVMTTGRFHRLDALCLLCICMKALAYVATAATPSSNVTSAQNISPSDIASMIAPAPSPGSALPSCEIGVLTNLGWQQAFNQAGYAINAELPSNCSLSTWQSLSCLQHLTNLTLIGSLPDLPDSWGANDSFPALQALNVSTASLAGPLPSSWAQGTAFAALLTMNLSMTQLSGTLPTTWSQSSAFPSLTEIYLHQTNIRGLSSGHPMLPKACFSVA